MNDLLLQRNVKEFLDAYGIKILVDFLAMSHVHTTRATVPLQASMQVSVLS